MTTRPPKFDVRVSARIPLLLAFEVPGVPEADRDATARRLRDRVLSYARHRRTTPADVLSCELLVRPHDPASHSPGRECPGDPWEATDLTDEFRASLSAPETTPAAGGTDGTA